MKRCPSFSKRPGFPSGLRVLLVDADSSARTRTECLLKDCNYTVTSCSTTAEALARLSSGSNAFDVLLADKAMVSGRTRDRQQLLHFSKELPCILMAAEPEPSDIYQGIKLGAVDFLAKPLSPLKLRNIWQHTVRKMMSDMTIKCPYTEACQQQEGCEQALSEDENMEDMEALIEAEMAMLEGKAAEQFGSSNSPLQCTSPAPDSASEGTLSRAASAAAVLETASPPSSPQQQQSLARSCSVGTISHPSPTKPPRPTTASGKPCVHSCPSTSSLRSSYSALAAPGSPSNTTSSAAAGQELSSSMSMGELSSMASGALDAAAAAAAATTAAAGATGCAATSSCCQARSKVKKAVRHLASANVANRPPLAIKPHTLAPAPASPASAATAAAPAAAAAPGAAPMGIPVGMTAVPLPTGLGPLPQGMVWGMPMCPLARAPGIVPPTTTPAAMPWGMSTPGMVPGACGPMPLMSAMAPMPPFMAGFPMMAGSMALTLPPGMAMASGMPMLPAAAAMAAPAAAVAGSLDCMAAPAAAAAVVGTAADGPQLGTGAAAAAALDASLASCDAGAVGMEHSSLHDFMLGDVSAEDDDDLGVLAFKNALPEHFNQLADELETKAHGLCALEGPLGHALDGDMAAEADKVGLCLTGYNISQQQLREDEMCYSSLQRQASMSSHRSSFESVSSGLCGPIRTTLMGSAGIAAAAAGAGKLGLTNFGSFSDLFAAARQDSPESSEEHMTRNDSSNMLAELESLFGPQGCQDEGSEGGLFEGLELPMALA